MSPDRGQPNSTPTGAARGLLLVISGPSGAGKSTVCNELLRRLPDAVWSISATTRPPRGRERDGREYDFVSREQFERMVEAGELLEWAEYLGHLYGTPRQPVRQALEAGKVIVLEIDVQGARQIAERMPDSLRIFLLPPNDEELARRLIGRRTETPEQQQRRLARAREEIRIARECGCYSHFITNHTVDCTVNQILECVQTQRAKP